MARVWTSSLSRAVQTAEIAAGVLGVDVVVREDLREYGVGSLAGTSRHEKAYFERVFRSWVEGDDDAAIDGGERVERRRREGRGGPARRSRTSTGARPPSWSATAAPSWRPCPSSPVCRGSVGSGVTLPNCGVIGLAADADGWQVTRWDGA